MFKDIIIILLVILMIGIFMDVRKKKVDRALRLIQRESQKTTDAAFSSSIKKIPEIDLDDQKQNFSSELVSNIWGSKVTAFEYSIEDPGIKTSDLPYIKKDLTYYLRQYATAHQLKAYQGNPVFYISDIWIFANVLHIDISHITNQATLSYIKDVKKSDKTN